MGWFNVHIKGSKAINSKLRCISFPEDCFTLANSSGPDEVPLCEALRFGLKCFSKYPFWFYSIPRGVNAIVTNKYVTKITKVGPLVVIDVSNGMGWQTLNVFKVVTLTIFMTLSRRHV